MEKKILYIIPIALLVLFILFLTKTISIYSYLKSIFHSCASPIFCESAIDSAPPYDFFSEIFLLVFAALSLIIAVRIDRKK